MTHLKDFAMIYYFSIYCTKLLITDIVKLYQILQMAILHTVK